MKLLTQEELLAEAAQTEIENLKSLEIMQALEEEVKKKAAVKRARYSGPYVRYHSKKVNDESLVSYDPLILTSYRAFWLYLCLLVRTRRVNEKFPIFMFSPS